MPRAAAVLDALDGIAGVYLVGGAVRDLLLGHVPGDLDLVVEGDGIAAARLLGERLGAPVTPHERFLTATVTVLGRPVDVATARRETYAEPGALPEVEPAPVAEDLGRRDVTINAIAAGLSGPRPGGLTAFPGALEDVEAGLLRVLHDRSFVDDPTRLVRIARYAGRLGFGLEPATERLARAAIGGGALGTVAAPRLGEELLLLLDEPSAPAALEWCARLGLSGALHPGFAPDRELAERALALLPGDARRAPAVLGEACRGLDPAGLERWLDGLGMPAAVRADAVAAAAWSPAAARALAAAVRPSEIAAAAAALPPAAVAVAGALGPAAAAAAWLDDLRHVRLDISGADLLAAGVPEGPAIGRALAAALVARQDGEAAGAAEQLGVALAAADAGGGGERDR